MAKYRAEITISLRKAILDVQGKAIETSLHSLEFTSINNIRVGKFITLDVEADCPNEAKSIVEEACNKLLANPIIEDFSIRLL